MENEKIMINGIEYVRADSMRQAAPKVDGMPYCMVRTDRAGVFAGYIEKRKGKEVTLRKARRIWRWAGVTFNNQTPTAKDHGALFAGILSDGILKGCALNYSGLALTVGTGYIIAAGRLFQISGAETLTLTGSQAYARLLVNLDMSAVATTSSFGQAYLSVDYASSPTGFQELTREDVNGSGVTYQAELAVLSLEGGVISGIVRQAPPAHSLVSVIDPDHYGSQLPASGVEGEIFFQIG